MRVIRLIGLFLAAAVLAACTAAPPSGVLLTDRQGFHEARVTVTLLEQLGEVSAVAVFTLPQEMSLLGHASDLNDMGSRFTLSSSAGESYSYIPDVAGEQDTYAVEVGAQPAGQGRYCYLLEVPYSFDESPGLDVLKMEGCA